LLQVLVAVAVAVLDGVAAVVVGGGGRESRPGNPILLLFMGSKK